MSVASESVKLVMDVGICYVDGCNCPDCRQLRDDRKARAELAELRAMNDRQAKSIDLYMAECEKLKAERLTLQSQVIRMEKAEAVPGGRA